MGKKKKIIVIAIAVIVVIGGVTGTYLYSNYASGQHFYKGLVTKAAPKVKSVYDRTIDFEALQQTNPDIYAWIWIPDTVIDYPILQSETDNAYYLNHTIEGTEGLPGSIYTENYNNKQFFDPNTVIYGHNMKNGSMFSALHNYEDIEFMKKHPYVYIFLPDKSLKFQVFASLDYSDDYILKKYNFQDASSYQEFLNEITTASGAKDVLNTEVEVSTADTLITLSTCIGNQPDKRRITVAVMEKAEH